MGKSTYLTDLQLNIISRLLDSNVDSNDWTEEEQAAFALRSWKLCKAIN